MRKTDALMKVVAFLLFGTLASYLGLNIYRRLNDPVQTALAVYATVTDTASMSGLAVRCEQVVISTEVYIEVTVSEGEKIAAGGSVATVYPSAGALDRARQLHTLEMEISQMAAALKAQQGGGTVNRDQTVYSALTALSADVRAGDFFSAGTHKSTLEGLIFKSDSADISQEALEQLQEQYQTLAEASAGETIAITVAEGGTFSTVVDGFEDLTPEQAAVLTPSALRDLASSSRSMPKGALGKIVSSYRWYYAAVMDAVDAGKLAVGDTVSLSFGRYYAGTLDARVESVGSVYRGECTVLFSMERGLAELMAVRSISADLIFQEFTGLRVPVSGLWRYYAGMLAEADAGQLSPGDEVTLLLDGQELDAFVSEVSGSTDDQGRRQAVFCWAWDDSQAPDGSLDARVVLSDGAELAAEPYYSDGLERLCVFTMTGLQAERKKVSMVYAGTEFCLVSSTGDDALREGNDIIVSVSGLYNGKVLD